MKFNFTTIIPVFGGADLAERSIESALSQEHENHKVIVCCDEVSRDREEDLVAKYKNIALVKSAERRLYALENILRAMPFVLHDSIVGIIDGDDELIRNDTLSLIQQEYENGYGCVWTAHSWDINGVNQSGPLDNSISPYRQKWCASHFRTFLKSDLNKINWDNFKDAEGKFFKRTYDQALMLPIIHLVLISGRKTKYIDKNCYLYRGRTEWGTDGNEYQINIENFIRNRGYVE